MILLMLQHAMLMAFVLGTIVHFSSRTKFLRYDSPNQCLCKMRIVLQCHALFWEILSLLVMALMYKKCTFCQRAWCLQLLSVGEQIYQVHHGQTCFTINTIVYKTRFVQNIQPTVLVCLNKSWHQQSISQNRLNSDGVGTTTQNLSDSTENNKLFYFNSVIQLDEFDISRLRGINYAYSSHFVPCAMQFKHYENFGNKSGSGCDLRVKMIVKCRLNIALEECNHKRQK